ncbi:hypothetical protein GCM10011344_27110 [Dokdonia pacifica]|uniref:Uncharacterized protein n=1 Tax=Dokdonia pacifica TaxID=1627892 RepID=A0A239E6I2_9FLAO|nr:hypothetical protein [Dokdonia pacifica]GGG25043.1 hypothetical protein GCM10011344_27110 [Dokdonia pacifica]SNS40325.1 hypothetical protein SAMN06265376_11433 [Dokdonia pacifica]
MEEVYSKNFWFYIKKEKLLEAFEKPKNKGGYTLAKEALSVENDFIEKAKELKLSEIIPYITSSTAYTTIGNNIAQGKLTTWNLRTLLCLLFSPKSNYTIVHLKKLFEQLKIYDLETQEKEDIKSSFNIFFKKIDLILDDTSEFKNYTYVFNVEKEKFFCEAIFEEKITEKGKLIEAKNFVSKNINDPDNSDLNHSLQEYFKNIRSEFSTIRLELFDFEIPISNYIQKPLVLDNPELISELKELQQERHECFTSKAKFERIDTIDRSIIRINTILKDSHNIMQVIDMGHHLFIEAPAGFGKSITLKWLAHTFANQKTPLIPIFIELMYDTENDFQKLFDKQIQSLKYDQNILSKERILLLLDEYDIETVDADKLFGTIKTLRSNYPKMQVVLSGRTKPRLSKYNLDILTYQIPKFELSDIKKFVFNYFQDDTKSSLYYDLILRHNLKVHLNNPLYLCMFLSLIGNKKQSYSKDHNSLIKSIVNKWTLFSKLIQDKFINDYEGDKMSADEGKWKERKHHHFQVLSLLAFEMVFKSKTVEKVTTSKFKEVCTQYYNKATLIDYTPSSTLDELIKHHLLIRNGTTIHFANGELQAFFIASYLKEHVSSYNSLKKYERDVANPKLWQSILGYLIGVLQPNQILDCSWFQDGNLPEILTEEFIEQYKLAIQFVHQKNAICGDYEILGTSLIQMSRLLLDRYETIESISILDHISSGIANELPILDIIQPNRYQKYKELNFFIHHLPFKKLGELGTFVKRLTKYNLGLSFEELIEFVEQIKRIHRTKSKEDKELYVHHIYRNVLDQEYTSVRLSTNQKVAITFEYFFKDSSDSQYVQFINQQGNLLKLFVPNVMRYHSSEFFNYLFDHLDDIPIFRIKRFIYNTVHKYRFWLTFKEGILSKESAKLIFESTKNVYLKIDENVKNHIKYERALTASTDIYLLDLYFNFFNNVIFDTSYPNKQRLRAFAYMSMSWNIQYQKEFLNLSNQRANQDDFLNRIIKKNFPKDYRYDRVDFISSCIDILYLYMNME